MIRELVVAACAAAVGGVLGIFPRYYPFWWSWNRAGLLVMLLPYLILTSAAGVIGWVLARVTRWSPWNGYWFLNGVTFGVMGQLILRFQWSPLGTAPTSLLGKALEQLTGWMDGLAQASIRTYVASLGRGDQFLEFAWELYAVHFKEDDRVKEPEKEAALREMRRNIRLLNSTEPDEQRQGLGQLRAFCEVTTLKRQVCKPRN